MSEDGRRKNREHLKLLDSNKCCYIHQKGKPTTRAQLKTPEGCPISMVFLTGHDAEEYCVANNLFYKGFDFSAFPDAKSIHDFAVATLQRKSHEIAINPPPVGGKLDALRTVPTEGFRKWAEQQMQEARAKRQEK